MTDNTSDFDNHTVPRKMMRYVQSGHAVISFPISCNGYHFNLLGARQEWHSVGYRARGIVAAVPTNKNPVKLGSAFLEIGDDQDWTAGSQQGRLDHHLSRTSVLRASLRNDCQIESSCRARKEFRKPDRSCVENHRFCGEAFSLPRFVEPGFGSFSGDFNFSTIIIQNNRRRTI